MCTVTFIPFGDRVFITHNRDEKKVRSRAIEPKIYTIRGQRLLFPRDGHAGGTWIGMNEKGQAAVLLNGAFVKHKHEPPYRKSRGIALLEMLVASDLFHAYDTAYLENIEPFTVILYSEGELRECRWDGSMKHIAHLDASQSYTWSSATLYEPEVLNKRENWFRNWQEGRDDYSLEDIMSYHQSGGDGDAQNDLRMNREDFMLTVSITGMEISQSGGLMHYIDLLGNSNTRQEFHFTKAPAIKE